MRPVTGLVPPDMYRRERTTLFMDYRSVDDVEKRLTEAGYIPSREIATVVFLAQATQKPVLIEGPAGVGKTELAKAVARSLGRELIRLQCYEGLDEAKALYEWEYAKQLLYTQMVKDRINDIIAPTATLTEAVDQIVNSGTPYLIINRQAVVIPGTSYLIINRQAGEFC